MIKSVSIEEVYADPHKLGPFLSAGEPVFVHKEGRKIAQLVPIGEHAREKILAGTADEKPLSKYFGTGAPLFYTGAKPAKPLVSKGLAESEICSGALSGQPARQDLA